MFEQQQIQTDLKKYSYEQLATKDGNIEAQRQITLDGCNIGIRSSNKFYVSLNNIIKRIVYLMKRQAISKSKLQTISNKLKTIDHQYFYNNNKYIQYFNALLDDDYRQSTLNESDQLQADRIIFLLQHEYILQLQNKIKNLTTNKENKVIDKKYTQVDINNFLQSVIQAEQDIVCVKCLGCLEYTYDGLKFDEAGQTYITFQYDNSNLEELLLKSICSMLNCGGGYVFIDAMKFQFSDQDTSNLQFYIKNIFDQNYSWKGCSLKINFLPYHKNPYRTYQQIPHRLYMIRLSIDPDCIGKIYHEDKCHCGSFQYYIWMYNNMGVKEKMMDIKDCGLKIGQLSSQQIYGYMCKVYSSSKNNSNVRKKCYSNNCVGTLLQRSSIINSLKLVYTNQNQEPNFKYRSCMIIITSKSKAEQTLKQMCQHLEENYIQYVHNRPFMSYNKKCQNHIYFFSFDGKFDNVLAQINKKKGDRKIQRNFIMLNPTKNIQIPIKQQPKASKQYLQQAKKFEKLRNQLDKNHITQQQGTLTIQQKQMRHPTAASTYCQSLLYMLMDLKYSIFLFIMVCSVDLRGYFVKDKAFQQG